MAPSPSFFVNRYLPFSMVPGSTSFVFRISIAGIFPLIFSQIFMSLTLFCSTLSSGVIDGVSI